MSDHRQGFNVLNAVAKHNGLLKSTKTTGCSAVHTRLNRKPQSSKQFQKEAGKQKKTHNVEIQECTVLSLSLFLTNIEIAGYICETEEKMMATFSPLQQSHRLL